MHARNRSHRPHPPRRQDLEATQATCDLPRSVHLGLVRIVLQRRCVVFRFGLGLLTGPGCRLLLLEHRHGAQRPARRYEAQAVGVHLRRVATIKMEVGVQVSGVGQN